MIELQWTGLRTATQTNKEYDTSYKSLSAMSLAPPFLSHSQIYGWHDIVATLWAKIINGRIDEWSLKMYWRFLLRFSFFFSKYKKRDSFLRFLQPLQPFSRALSSLHSAVCTRHARRYIAVPDLKSNTCPVLRCACRRHRNRRWRMTANCPCMHLLQAVKT